LIKTFDSREDVQLLNGRYGAYLKIGKNNYKLPKDKKPEDLTLEECLELAENQGTKKSFKKK
jgi:DNA topoisomerase-1